MGSTSSPTCRGRSRSSDAVTVSNRPSPLGETTVDVSAEPEIFGGIVSVMNLSAIAWYSSVRVPSYPSAQIPAPRSP